jgi:BlaI family penicillinase repressor
LIKKNYGLTNTELLIMELLWSEGRPMSFREIMDVATKEWKKDWKVQTLNTFLNGLQKMGMIRAERSMTSSYNVYYPLYTKEQHIHKWTKEMVEVCYDNSFRRLVSAFIGDGKLSKEDAEELKKLLD